MLKIEKSIFLSKPLIGIVGRRVDSIYKVNNSVVEKIIKCGGVAAHQVAQEICGLFVPTHTMQKRKMIITKKKMVKR